MGGWGGGHWWPNGVPDRIRRQDDEKERRREDAPDAPDTTDQLARSYANLRFECADLEAIIGAEGNGLSDKDLKRLDKAVTVMKVGFKLIARVLRRHGHETGRKRLSPPAMRADSDAITSAGAGESLAAEQLFSHKDVQ